jgi:hypothetical protein
MSKTRQDFKVYEEQTRSGKTLWRIKTGGINGDVVTSCSTNEQANYFAFKLNQDPWFMNRGDTRAEQNKNS